MADHSCQCRAVNAPAVGQTLGKMMAEEVLQNLSQETSHRWLRPSQFGCGAAPCGTVEEEGMGTGSCRMNI